MKAKSILGLFIFLLSMGLVSSCEDMLTPDMDTYQDANGRTLKDTVNSYFGILRSVQQVVEQNTILGEIRGDLVTTTSFTTDSISKLANFENLADEIMRYSIVLPTIMLSISATSICVMPTQLVQRTTTTICAKRLHKSS